MVPCWIAGLSLMVAVAAATTNTVAPRADPEGFRDKRTLQLILRGLADALGYEVRPTTTSTPPPTPSGPPPTKPPRMPEPVTDPRMRPPYDVDDLLSYGIKPDSTLAQYVRNNAGRNLRQEYEKTKGLTSSESSERKQQSGSKAEYSEPEVNSIGKVHEYPHAYNNRPQATVLSKESRNSSRFFNEPQNDVVDNDTKYFGTNERDSQNEEIHKLNNYTSAYNSGPELEEFGRESKYTGAYHSDPQSEGFGKENEYSNVFFNGLRNKELGKDPNNVFGIGINRSGDFNIDSFGSGHYVPEPTDHYSGLLAYESHSPSKGSELFQNWVSSSIAPFTHHYSSYFPSWSAHKDGLQTHENYFQARNDFQQEEEARVTPEAKPTAPVPAVSPLKNLGILHILHEMEDNKGHQERAVPPFDHASESSVSHLRGSHRKVVPESHSNLPSSQQQAPVTRRNNATIDDSIQPRPWSYYRYPHGDLPYLPLQDSTRSSGRNETSEDNHSFADLRPKEFYSGKATDSEKSTNASISSIGSHLSPWFQNKDTNRFRTAYEAEYPQGVSTEEVQSTPWSYFVAPVKFLYRNEPNTNSAIMHDTLASLQTTNDTGVNQKKRKDDDEPPEGERKSKQVGVGSINKEFFNHPEANWKTREEVTTERAELVAGRYLGLIVPKFLGLPVKPSNYVYSTKTTMVAPNGGGETRSTEAVSRVSKLHVTGHLSVYPDK